MKYFLVLFLLLPMVVQAADILPPQLTLQDAIARAIAGNSDLALVKSREESSAISVETARGKYQPSLQFNAGANDTFLHNPAPGESSSVRSANLQLNANLNLFNGFGDRAGLDSAERQLLAARGDVQRQRETLAFDVISRFVDILTDRELIQVAEQNLASQQALQEQIAAFQKAGVRTLADLYQQQAATAQASSSLLSARRDLKLVRLQLLQLFGLEAEAPFEAVPPDGTELSSALQSLSGETLRQQAFDQRADLAALQRRIEVARQQVGVARAGALPSLDLQAATGSSYSSRQSGGIRSQLGDDNLETSVGLSLNIPLFDRAASRTAVAQARNEELAATVRLSALRQQIATDSGQALFDYQLALQQKNAAQLQLRAAREALKIIEERFRVGVSTWVELTTARANAVQAQGEEIRTRYAVLRQGLKIGYVRGDLFSLLQHLNSKEKS